MINLDPRRLPRDVATLLQLRGSGLPPLQMHEGANRAAKATLDAYDRDAELLGKANLADEPMGAAVRAMLYLWNGWPDDCRMIAQLAPPRERDYVTAICDRQAGKVEAAKAQMRAVERHPIFGGLVSYAQKSIGLTTVPALARFWKLIEMIGEWEPFAFIDLYSQALAGSVSGMAVTTVQNIQCLEFEALLVHCFEAAVGETLPTNQVDEEKEALRKLREHRRRAGQTKKHTRESPAPETAPTTAVMTSPGLKLRCPKCQHMATVPESSRGSSTTCERCKAKFTVPAKQKLGAAPPSLPPGSIGIRCPKCATMATLPPTARGKTNKCATCGQAFLIPR